MIAEKSMFHLDQDPFSIQHGRKNIRNHILDIGSASAI